MRILFTFVGGQGHYDPLVPLARAARALGHEVTFACRASMVPVVGHDGFPAVAVGPDVPDPLAPGPLAPRDGGREERVLRDGFVGTSAPARAAGLLARFRARPPDVVVADEVDVGATVASERARIPRARVVTLVAGGFFRPDVVAGRLDEVRRAHGLPADPALDALDRLTTLAPFPPSLRDPAFPLPAHARHLRPPALEPPDDPTGRDTRERDLPDRGDRRPLVVVTLGTVFVAESGDLLARVLGGLGRLPVRVACALGRHLDPATLGTVPPNVTVHGFVPLAHLLRGAAALVSHGGSGSVVAAAALGVPAVVLPMGADQPHNARRVESLGIGLVLDAWTATPDDLAAAVERVLDEPGVRDALERLRAEAAALPTATDAVRWIDALARAR
jgi:UDP:flavonoid glycosyltransferase YjiC (YdhE family)